MPTSRPLRIHCIALTAFVFAPALSSREATAQTAPARAVPRRQEAPLAQAGASLFALTYLASALAATTGYGSTSGTDSSRAALWVPAAGPFIMMGSVKAAGQDALLVLDGLSQVAGVTLFVYGLESKPSAVTVVPSVARGAPGAALFATF